MTQRPMAVALALGMTSLACSTKSASEYETSDMVATLHATATGSGSTQVQASLHDPSNPLTFVQLTADDKIEASHGAETQTMKEASLLGAVSYSASFNGDAAESEFHVKLTRKVDAGAPDSHVTLPKPFTVAALGKSTYSRTEPIAVTWTAETSADAMKLDIAGSCLDGVHTGLDPAASTYTIAANTLKKRAPASGNDQVADECEATVTLTRSRDGVADPAFHSNSSFVGKQVRTLTFTTKP
ncbi:MAG: hypothetical protein HY901_13050 [Deltaproteobacteria bacterium]|nr:hypothetical protein [Deltaproteobacteria bacterium]